MILTIHALVGAAITTQIRITWLAWLLAFFSHFLLDCIPHHDYSLKGVELGWKNKKFWWVIFKVALDLALGFILIIIFSQNKRNLINIIIGGLLGILPDGFNVISRLLRNQNWKKFLSGAAIEGGLETKTGIVSKTTGFYIQSHESLQFFSKKPQKLWGIINQIIVLLTALILL